MGRQGNRLAWLLDNSYWIETMVEKGLGDPENEASHECDRTAYVSTDGNVLSGHVAKVFTRFGTIHKIGLFEEGGKNQLDA